MAKELEEYRNEQERIRKEYERKRREEEARRLAAERLKASKTPTYLTAVEDDIETSTKQEEYVEVKAQEIQAVVVYEPQIEKQKSLPELDNEATLRYAKERKKRAARHQEELLKKEALNR